MGDKEWVWQPPCRQPGQRLEGGLNPSLPPSLPPSVAPCVCSVLPAGSPCSNTMVDRIKVTFLAVTVADNLSHEFNMPRMEYCRKVLIIWHGLIPHPPSGFDGWELMVCCALLRTSDANCVTAAISLFSQWRCWRPSWLWCFIFRGERSFYTSGHVWAQDMWEMYLRQPHSPPLHTHSHTHIHTHIHTGFSKWV